MNELAQRFSVRRGASEHLELREVDIVHSGSVLAHVNHLLTAAFHEEGRLFAEVVADHENHVSCVQGIVRVVTG